MGWDRRSVSAVVIILWLFVSSCGFEQNERAVKMRLKIQPPREEDLRQTGASLHPASATLFKCFVVNVVGDGIPSQAPTNYPVSRLSTMLDGNSCMYPGVTSAPFALDGPTAEISLNVPVGDNRIIQILGLHGVTECETDSFGSLLEATTAPGRKYRQLYELARTQVDITQATSLSLASTYDASDLKKANCFNERVGTGVFEGPTTVSLNLAARELTNPIKGDFNNDGLADLVFGSKASVPTDPTLIVFGDGDSGIASTKTFNTPVQTALFERHDYNGDGRQDLLSAIEGTGEGLQVYLSNGDGTFEVPATVNLGFFTPKQIDIVDINNDDSADLVLAGPSFLQRHLGDGSGSFNTPTSFSAYSSFEFKFGDIDGDDIQDLVFDQSSPYSGFYVSFGVAAGDFDLMSATPLSPAPGNDFEIVDFDQDGDRDLIRSGPSAYLNYFPGNGDGTFGAGTMLGDSDLYDEIKIGDFNADGYPDILGLSTSSGAKVFLNDQVGGLETPQSLLSGTFVKGAVIADLNNDGVEDIALSTETGDEYFVFINDTDPAP